MYIWWFEHSLRPGSVSARKEAPRCGVFDASTFSRSSDDLLRKRRVPSFDVFISPPPPLSTLMFITISVLSEKYALLRRSVSAMGHIVYVAVWLLRELWEVNTEGEGGRGSDRFWGWRILSHGVFARGVYTYRHMKLPANQSVYFQQRSWELLVNSYLAQ